MTPRGSEASWSFFFLIWLGFLCAQVSFENCDTIEWLFLRKVPPSNLQLYAFLPEYHPILPTVPPPQACTGRKQPRTYKTSPQATCYLPRVGEQRSKLLPYLPGFLDKAKNPRRLRIYKEEIKDTGQQI